ncbi:MAG: hypothetical protein Kow00121_40910 [Elainellaceae cyanobacterium]
MAQTFKQGDKVEWKVGQGKTVGTVQKKITKSIEVEGNQIAASEDAPRYVVKNDHTGQITGHKPETLTKVDQSQQQSSQHHKHGAHNKQDNEQSDEPNNEQINAFREAVNMTSKQLEAWLKTEESQSVGQKKDGDESIGHQSGKRIVELLHKNKSKYTEDDLSHMGKVVSYIHRHLAQRPSGDIEDTRWRYSLMNWGHDPLK